jgi:antitoxin HicB
METKNLKYYQRLYYNIIVSRDTIDNDTVFIAYSKELGKFSCYGIGETEQEAIKTFLEEKDAFIEFLFKEGKVIPEPNQDVNDLDQYSGVFNIRTSSLLHYKLVQHAKDQGLSMNMYINQLLAVAIGERNSQSIVLDRLNEICTKIDNHHYSLTQQLQYNQMPKMGTNPKFAGFHGDYELKVA